MIYEESYLDVSEWLFPQLKTIGIIIPFLHENLMNSLKFLAECIARIDAPRIKTDYIEIRLK